MSEPVLGIFPPPIVPKSSSMNRGWESLPWLNNRAFVFRMEPRIDYREERLIILYPAVCSTWVGGELNPVGLVARNDSEDGELISRTGD